jgi:hypothetical protein
MKDNERQAWTEFVRKREQASKGKKRERHSEQTPEPAAKEALDDLLREAAAKQGGRLTASRTRPARRSP